MKGGKFSLTAAQLRILALLLMLVDHVGRTVFPEQLWMVGLGRLAFPIFAFQTAEGYRHTRDLKRYCLRLAVFALVSEVPFNLMVDGGVFFPGHQNVMFTMLLGLLCCRAWDGRRWWQLALLLFLAEAGQVDYGMLGVGTVLVFHVFRQDRILLPFFLGCIHLFGWGFPSVQGFAVLAWLPISRYRGEKGRGGKWLQYGSYLFYPLHMLLLGLL